MTGAVDAVLAEVGRERAQALARWQTLLRFASVGTDPAFAGPTAAAWLTDQLQEIGFQAQAIATPGQPVVLGHHPGTGQSAPHVLYYGHYDVQPAEPLELWSSPPFEPTVVDGPHGPRMVARGAVDDKGQVMTWLEALRAWHVAAGGPPVPVTVLIEGEEESGSPSLEGFLEQHRAELAGADVCVVSDTCMWDVDTPALAVLLRGLLYTQIDLRTLSHDLHSGLYGGAVPNPLNLLVEILADLHDADRRVRLPGFYDQVREPVPEVAARWRALPMDEAAFLAGVGAGAPWGETGRTTLERVWSRPTCDINGIWGGYTGPGTKTVIPAEAHAKLSFRLVPDQEPKAVLDSLRAFVTAKTPPGATVEIHDLGSARALRLPVDSPFLEAANRALRATFATEPVWIGMGGSIPAVEAIKRIVGVDALLLGFGLEDDRVHSPNEKFELVCFERGIEVQARALDEFAHLGRAAGAA
jgi:acetylornithine deacetylase/succinyl-diaminopimelate desuccinylase-like protein